MATYFIDARTATPHFPGIGRYITNLVAALLEQIDATESLRVLIPPPTAQIRNQGQPWSETLSASARSKPQRSTQLSTIVADASQFSLAQQWRVPRVMRQMQQIDQAGLRSHGAGIYHTPYYLMPYRTGLPNVVTLHDLIALVLPETVSLRARWLFRLTVQAALRAATRVIVGAESARQDLLTHFPINPSHVVTVPHAAAERFHPQSEAAIHDVRSHYQLPNEFIFYCGINKPHKNLVRLIEAYAALDTLSATVPQLIIAGAWDDRYPQPRQEVERRGLQTRVRFLGPVSDDHLPALYAAATLFVFPSLYEGFGLPVIEAMACGAPVACSNATGLRDVAGDAALQFNPQEVGSIVTALRTAIDNPPLRADLRTRSLARAKQFTWASTAQQTLAIYREMLR